MGTVADLLPKTKTGGTVADLLPAPSAPPSNRGGTVADLLPKPKSKMPHIPGAIYFKDFQTGGGGPLLSSPVQTPTGETGPMDTSWGGFVREHRASVPRGKKRPETDNPWPDDPRFKLLYDRANMGMQIDEKYLQGLSNEQTAFLLSRSSRPLTKYKEPKNYGVERWVPLVASESQAKAWETEGEQKFVESMGRGKIKIPFLSAFQKAIYYDNLLAATDRLAKGKQSYFAPEYVYEAWRKEPPPPNKPPVTREYDLGRYLADKKLVEDYLYQLDEDMIRGKSMGGMTAGILQEMPAFMIEFLATSGLAGLGKKGAEKGLEKMALHLVKKKGLKWMAANTPRLLKTLELGKQVAGTAAGAAARMPGMLPRVAESYAERRLPLGTFDKDGTFHVTEGGETPIIAFYKAAMDTYVEMLSESSGPAISKAIRAGGKFTRLDKIAKLLRLGGKGKIKDLASRTGYHGVIEEIGEERLGEILRAATGVEDYSLPTLKQLGAELISFSVPGAAVAAGTALEAKKGYQRSAEGEIVQPGPREAVQLAEEGPVQGIPPKPVASQPEPTAGGPVKPETPEVAGRTPPAVSEKEIKITRHFEKYTSDQRASRQSSHRLGHRQKESIGEYFYTNEYENIAYSTKKAATEGAKKYLAQTPAQAEPTGEVALPPAQASEIQPTGTATAPTAAGTTEEYDFTGTPDDVLIEVYKAQPDLTPVENELKKRGLDVENLLETGYTEPYETTVPETERAGVAEAPAVSGRQRTVTPPERRVEEFKKQAVAAGRLSGQQAAAISLSNRPRNRGQKAAAGLAKRLSGRAIFVTGGKEANFNGIQLDRDWLIADDSPNPALAVLGHEVHHTLVKEAKSDPRLKADLEKFHQTLRESVPKGRYRKRMAKMKTAAESESDFFTEYAGDYIGEAFANTTFWIRLQRKGGKLYARIARTMYNILRRLGIRVPAQYSVINDVTPSKQAALWRQAEKLIGGFIDPNYQPFEGEKARKPDLANETELTIPANVNFTEPVRNAYVRATRQRIISHLMYQYELEETADSTVSVPDKILVGDKTMPGEVKSFLQGRAYLKRHFTTKAAHYKRTGKSNYPMGWDSYLTEWEMEDPRIRADGDINYFLDLIEDAYVKLRPDKTGPYGIRRSVLDKLQSIPELAALTTRLDMLEDGKTKTQINREMEQLELEHKAQFQARQGHLFDEGEDILFGKQGQLPFEEPSKVDKELAKKKKIEDAAGQQKLFEGEPKTQTEWIDRVYRVVRQDLAEGKKVPVPGPWKTIWLEGEDSIRKVGDGIQIWNRNVFESIGRNVLDHWAKVKKLPNKYDLAKKYGESFYEEPKMQERKEKGIKINPDLLSRTELAKINTFLKRKGYDSRGIADVREMLKTRIINKEGYITLPDWIEAIEYGRTVRKQTTAEKAAREFGTTTNWREAGYITQTGAMIDMSGKREGGPPNERALDHREIHRVIDSEKIGEEYSDGMIYFMNEGNIRIDFNAGLIDMYKEPTPVQYSRLRQMIRRKDGEVYVEAGDKEFYMEYDKGDSPDGIINDIKRYFAGEEPRSDVAKFHVKYQKRIPPEGEEPPKKPGEAYTEEYMKIMAERKKIRDLEKKLESGPTQDDKLEEAQRIFADRPKGEIEEAKWYKRLLHPLLNMVQLRPARGIERKNSAAYAAIVRMTHAPEAHVLDWNQEVFAEFADMTFDQLTKKMDKLSDQTQFDIQAVRGRPVLPLGRDIARESHSRTTADPKINEYARMLQQAYDYNYQRLMDLGLEATFFEDYFYGDWEDASAARRVFEKHFKTTSKFLKEKTIPTVADGLALRLKLKDKNPMRNVLRQFMAIERLAAMKHLRDELVKMDAGVGSLVVKTIDATEAQMETWKEIGEEISGQVVKQEPVMQGLLFHPDVARFINNMIKVNQTSRGGIKTFRNWTHATSALKLLLPFHHLRVIITQAFVDTGLGGFLVPGRAKVFKAFLGVKRYEKYAWYKDFIAHGGGHKYSWEYESYRILNQWLKSDSKNFAWRYFARPPLAPVKLTKDVISAPGRLLFNHYIPAIKALHYKFHLDRLEKKQGREADDYQKIQIIKEGMYMFGEMNERLFGRSATATSVLRLFYMFPGFREGNYSNMYKATSVIWDKQGGPTGRAWRSAVNIPQYLFVTWLLCRIWDKLMNDEDPKLPESEEEFRDQFKLKTKYLDPKGRRVYIDIMTTDKDYYNQLVKPAWELASGKPMQSIGTFFGNLFKTHGGMVSPMRRFINDIDRIVSGQILVDYWGNQVYYKIDSPWDKLLKIGLHFYELFQPIPLSIAERLKKWNVPDFEAHLIAATGIRPSLSEEDKKVTELWSKFYSYSNKREEMMKIIRQEKLKQVDIDNFNRSLQTVIDHPLTRKHPELIKALESVRLKDIGYYKISALIRERDELLDRAIEDIDRGDWKRVDARIEEFNRKYPGSLLSRRSVADRRKRQIKQERLRPEIKEEQRVPVDIRGAARNLRQKENQ